MPRKLAIAAHPFNGSEMSRFVFVGIELVVVIGTVCKRIENNLHHKKRSFDFAQDLGSGLGRPLNASS